MNDLINGNEPVQIAGDELTDPLHNFRGRLYWIAYYRGGWPTTVQRTEFWAGTSHPAEDYTTDLIAYMDFSQEVGATYTTELGTGANAPYVFDVLGTPTRGSTSVDDTSIVGQLFGVNFPTSSALGHQFNGGYVETQSLNANRFKVVGTGTALWPDSDGDGGRAGVTRKYPRLSIFDLGKLREE